jgi:cell division protease FtsH
MDCSEQTAREIDQEVKKLLDQAYAEAKAILREHRRQLDLVAGELLERETLDGKSFKRLLEQAGPQPGDETSQAAGSAGVNSQLEVETTKAKKQARET